MRIDGVSTQPTVVTQGKAQTNDEKVPIKQDENHTNTDMESLKNVSKYTKDEMSVSEKVIIEAIEKANKAIEGPNKRFEFSIHKKTHEIMVKVLDNDTGDVIREFPPEKILDMVAKLWEMAGIVVDERR